MNIQELIRIAKETGQVDLQQKFEDIAQTMGTENAPLVLPLVGEFSAGKTTLINALTDSKKLEVATKPTTATVYEIFFGQEKCSASVVKNDGSIEEIADVSELKNNALSDALMVQVFDTSSKISRTTVLVDTPGLSSSDTRHREALVGFMPKADGVLLVTDINQQITKSLANFAKDIALSNRPLYLVVTKCDTKSAAELQEVKEYILKNSALNIKAMAFVSAQTGDVQELYNLLSQVDSEKAQILRTVNESRAKNIAKLLLSRIDELIQNASVTDTGDGAIKSAKNDLEKFQRNIENLLSDVKDSIVSAENDVCYSFATAIFERLERIAVSKNANFDAEASAAVSGVAGQCLNSFKSKIQDSLFSLAQERRGSENAVNLMSLNEIDYSFLNISQLPYNLNLNELGHENDSVIACVTKFVAGAGLVIGTVATMGALAATSAGAAIAKEVAGSTDALITAVAINKANKTSNQQRDAELARLRSMHESAMQDVEGYNQMLGKNIGMKKGFVEGIVAKITDAVGKPQRQRAIRNYIDDILVPEFKNQMNTMSLNLIASIRTALNKEAAAVIEQKTANLEELKAQKEKSAAEFNARISVLKEYKAMLERA